MNIKDLGLHLLRQKIAYISQQPFLIQGTIYENLDPFTQLKTSEVKEVLRKVQLLDFIENLP